MPAEHGPRFWLLVVPSRAVLGDAVEVSVEGEQPARTTRLSVESSPLPVFREGHFEVGNAFVGEARVGSGAFESFLKTAVFLGELLNPRLRVRSSVAERSSVVRCWTESPGII